MHRMCTDGVIHRRNIFSARAVSYYIRSATFANDTSSLARLAIKRFRIGEKGGSFPNATRALSLTFGAFTETVTFFISAAPRKNREYCLPASGTMGLSLWIHQRPSRYVI